MRRPGSYSAYGYPSRAYGGPYASAGTSFTPLQLAPFAWYDVHLGGSATEIADSSGNGHDPIVLAAAGNQPLWLPYTQAYATFPGVAGNSISTPHSAAISLNGDMGFRVHLNPFLTANGSVVAKRTNSANAANNYELRVLANGTIRFSAYDTTTAAPLQYTSTAAISTGWQYIDVALDSDNGANSVATFSTSTDGTSFTQLGDPVASTILVPTEVADANLTIGASQNGAADPFPGHIAMVQVRDAGSVVAEWNAADCGQTGYTHADGTVWTFNRSAAGRKAVMLSPAAVAIAGENLHGTDDYDTFPATALPPMDAADPWALVMVIRQWDTASNFGRYFSTKQTSGTGKGIALRTNGTTRQIACHFSDGTTGVDTFGPGAAANGVRQVICVNCTGPSVTISVNGVAGAPVDISTVGDRSSVQAAIGRDTGSSSNYQDFQHRASLLLDHALTPGAIANLVAYYRGGF